MSDFDMEIIWIPDFQFKAWIDFISFPCESCYFDKSCRELAMTRRKLDTFRIVVVATQQIRAISNFAHHHTKAWWLCGNLTHIVLAHAIFTTEIEGRYDGEEWIFDNFYCYFFLFSFMTMSIFFSSPAYIQCDACKCIRVSASDFHLGFWLFEPAFSVDHALPQWEIRCESFHCYLHKKWQLFFFLFHIPLFSFSYFISPSARVRQRVTRIKIYSNQAKVTIISMKYVILSRRHRQM